MNTSTDGANSSKYQKKKIFLLELDFLQIINKYAVLSENENSASTLECTIPKSPPIFTSDVENFRFFTVVMRNFLYSTPIKDIKEEVLGNVNGSRNINKAKTKISKLSLSLFFVDLDPKNNNKGKCSIKYFKNSAVAIEPFRKSKEIALCHIR